MLKAQEGRYRVTRMFLIPVLVLMACEAFGKAPKADKLLRRS
jgi:hypothetical protein